MNIQEFRVGNIVSFVLPNTPVEVTGVYDDFICTAQIRNVDYFNAERGVEDFNPVNLTDDWLEVMGLQNHSGMFSLPGADWYISSQRHGLILNGHIFICQIQHVHQLQNIISSLFGLYLSPVLETFKQNIKVGE